MKMSQAAVLRLAVQNLANAPQAQRRYVQLNILPKSIADLELLGADPRSIEDGDQFSDEGVELIRRLRQTVIGQMEEHDDLMELNRSRPRQYLFSDALENEAWEIIRQLARACHLEIAGEASAFVALMAK